MPSLPVAAISKGCTAVQAWRLLPAPARASALLVVLTLLAAACGPKSAEPVFEERPPNILLISIDTLRADHLGAYGFARNTSPRLDALAADSVLFENAFSSSSWTLPALASMLTGEHSSTHACRSFASALGSGFTTLAERLLAFGYDTASFTANVFTGRDYGLQQGVVLAGYDVLPTGGIPLEESISSPEISDKGIAYIEAKGRARQEANDPWPWFLWLHYFDPHDAYLFHEGVSEEFATEGADELQHQRDLYDGEIRFTDQHIGRVLDALFSSGQAESTIVLVVSDHGEEFADHGRRHHGHTLYRELTHIPFFVHSPGVAPARIEARVQMVDVVPTLLELAGAPLPSDLPGRSLVPFLKNRQLAPRPTIQEVSLLPFARLQAIEDGIWTLILDLSADGATQLFQTSIDPGEKHDVSGDHADVVERLEAILAEQLARARSRVRRFGGAASLDLAPDQVEALRDLGYAGRER